MRRLASLPLLASPLAFLASPLALLASPLAFLASPLAFLASPLALLASPLALPTSASAAELDTKGPLYCALVDVYDCSPGECAEIESESVALPDVLRVDAEKKMATALDQEFEGATSPLDSVETVGGKIVARSQQVDRLLVVAIEVAGGDAIVTVTDPKTTLVAYAECVEP